MLRLEEWLALFLSGDKEKRFFFFFTRGTAHARALKVESINLGSEERQKICVKEERDKRPKIMLKTDYGRPWIPGR